MLDRERQSFEAVINDMFNVSTDRRFLQVPHCCHYKDTYTTVKLEVQPTTSQFTHSHSWH